MMQACMRSRWFLAVFSLALLVGVRPAAGQEIKGQRVFFSGHSFHYFMPPILADIAKKADIKDHTQLGLSAIGGSRVYQHWNVADDKNKAKEALKGGKVDVFTMAPIYLPDDGIEKFVKLGLENNPKMRFFVQENWLPWDYYEVNFKAPKGKVDHNAPDGGRFRASCTSTVSKHPYHYRDDAEMSEAYETKAVHIAPVGQAVIKLRERIIASARRAGVEGARMIFSPIRSATPIRRSRRWWQLRLLRSDLRKSPVGLPVPAVLAKANESEKLNRLLQEIAWEAVTAHPLSGVKAGK